MFHRVSRTVCCEEPLFGRVGGSRHTRRCLESQEFSESGSAREVLLDEATAVSADWLGPRHRRACRGPKHGQLSCHCCRRIRTCRLFGGDTVSLQFLEQALRLGGFGMLPDDFLGGSSRCFGLALQCERLDV